MEKTVLHNTGFPTGQAAYQWVLAIWVFVGHGLSFASRIGVNCIVPGTTALGRASLLS